MKDLYGIHWRDDLTEIDIEREMIRKGGRWTTPKGAVRGEGLLFHFMRFQQLLWPDKLMEVDGIKNDWAEILTKCFLQYTYIGIMGCAAGGKSDSSASFVLADWYCWPECTTVILSSTDIKSLKRRIWGILASYHSRAKQRWKNCPGYLIEGELTILNDSRKTSPEGRDFRNGLVGVPCYKGTQFNGLASYVGIHNKRVRVVFDESNLMPRAVVDSSSNLSKAPDFKMIAPGNPNETTNAHGMLCEPHFTLGGWDSGIDQTAKTKTWQTRFPNGICVQLPGSDTPNMKAPEGAPVPFPFLMTRQQMKDDAEIWGVDDWHYAMMNEARMPRGQGSRRILTRQICQRNMALEDPIWADSNRTRIGCLDAAYGGVGGDRCVFGHLEFGREATSLDPAAVAGALVTQNVPADSRRMILTLVELLIVPISAEKGSDPAEDQIARFCKAECERRVIPEANFFYDSGMRSSLVMAFSRIWSPRVNALDCGGKPSERPVGGNIEKLCVDHYFNRITEMWWSVRLVIESKQFRGLTEAPMTEGCQREWMMVSGNKIQAEPKDEMKKKTGRSPDLMDTVTIGVEGARQRGFVIANFSNHARRKTEDTWKRALQDQADKLWRSKELVPS